MDTDKSTLTVTRLGLSGSSRERGSGAGRTRPWLEIVLAGAVVIVLAAIVAVVIGGARVLPWQTKAESVVARQAQVRDAASAGVLAFLDVDYHDMDTRMKKVESLSTGTFKKQYAATSVDLKAAAQQAQAVSQGTIGHVAINRLTADTGVLLVTASNVVTNTDTKSTKATTACPKAGSRCDQYRFVVTVTKVGDRWLLSDLAGVS
ncbi:hypothetical protein [Nocardioides sp.]|uniref:hypothetical protein n=1 Tax=Nocardioides sp. TaxID=35761 RepID=UPI002619EF13|nr:hypothetical protein [Nocardioides sp.]